MLWLILALAAAALVVALVLSGARADHAMHQSENRRRLAVGRRFFDGDSMWFVQDDEGYIEVICSGSGDRLLFESGYLASHRYVRALELEEVQA